GTRPSLTATPDMPGGVFGRSRPTVVPVVANASSDSRIRSMYARYRKFWGPLPDIPVCIAKLPPTELARYSRSPGRDAGGGQGQVPAAGPDGDGGARGEGAPAGRQERRPGQAGGPLPADVLRAPRDVPAREARKA